VIPDHDYWDKDGNQIRDLPGKPLKKGKDEDEEEKRKKAASVGGGEEVIDRLAGDL
jgi:hypothetical protein